MQDTQMPHEGEAVCKLCWDALSPAETWQDRGGKHWELLLKLNSHITGVDSYEKWDEKKKTAIFPWCHTKKYPGCFYYVLFHYFRVKVNMEINMLLRHNTVIVKEVAILKLY